jgi:hypothetical protein
MRPPGVTHLQSRRRLVALCVAVLAAVAVTLAAVGPVVGHGNHATANAQVSADGTVRLEEVFLAQDGFLVLHRDDGGQPGAVIGHRPIDGGLYTDVSVRVDPAVWQNVSGNVTLWATVHASNGDGQFRPGDDPLLYWFGEPAGDRITVGKRDGAVAVLTRGGGALESGQLPVTRVVFGQRGHLVVHAAGDSDDSLGRVVGHRTLPAGNHSDVRVPVSIPAPSGNETRRLRVVAYRDDGDGRFDDGDAPVRVAGDPVESTYLLHAARATPTAAIRTPSPTDSAGTTTAPAGASDADTTVSERPNPTTTTADGPGPGVTGVIVGVLLGIAGLARWRR